MGNPMVVAVSGDPGGANAVAPVIEMLRAEGRVNVRAFAYRQARDVFARHGLEFEELLENTTQIDALKLLQGAESDLLLAGTSCNGIDLERIFTAAASVAGMPSLAVLDFWSNYKQRFSGAGGHVVYMPDRIAVMDDQACIEMAAEGFDPARLVVTGQPAFDDLARCRSSFSDERRSAVRGLFDIGADELMVLFASQPFSLLYSPDHALYPGYDEQIVLRGLVAALDAIAQRQGRDIALVVRPHPREGVESLQKIMGSKVRVLVSCEGESRELAMAADLVTGMSTMLLVESCYLGCVTASLQPGLRLPDMLPTNHIGLSRPIYRENDMEPALEELLVNESARQDARLRLSGMQNDGNASKRVMELAYSIIFSEGTN